MLSTLLPWDRSQGENENVLARLAGFLLVPRTHLSLPANAEVTETYSHIELLKMYVLEIQTHVFILADSYPLSHCLPSLINILKMPIT